MVRFLESWSVWESEGLHRLWQMDEWISHCLKNLYKMRRSASFAQGIPGHLLLGGWGQEDPGQGIPGVPEPGFVRMAGLSVALRELWGGACIVNR